VNAKEDKRRIYIYARARKLDYIIFSKKVPCLKKLCYRHVIIPIAVYDAYNDERNLELKTPRILM
jgi:hypothetical protein